MEIEAAASPNTNSDATSPNEVPAGFGDTFSKYWTSVKKFIGDKYRLHVSGVLKCGPMPRHIAFIMDGNRRFARKLHAETKTGHTLGGEALKDALKWCTELGITTVTVFAFSIENFKRTTDEVDTLMQIAHSKLGELLNHEGTKKIFKIKGIGDMSLLPEDLQCRIRQIEERTKDNEGGVFNVCFSYSSTSEITNAVKAVVHERMHQKPQPSTSPENKQKEGLMYRTSSLDDEEGEGEISENDLERCLLTYGSADLDMIIRTSGEIRLSDFMLWQSSASCVVITDVLWPEFSPNHLYAAILYYQEHYEKLKALRSTLENQYFAYDGLSEHPTIKVE